MHVHKHVLTVKNYNWIFLFVCAQHIVTCHAVVIVCENSFIFRDRHNFFLLCYFFRVVPIQLWLFAIYDVCMCNNMAQKSTRILSEFKSAFSMWTLYEHFLVNVRTMKLFTFTYESHYKVLPSLFRKLLFWCNTIGCFLLLTVAWSHVVMLCLCRVWIEKYEKKFRVIALNIIILCG